MVCSHHVPRLRLPTRGARRSPPGSRQRERLGAYRTNRRALGSSAPSTAAAARRDSARRRSRIAEQLPRVDADARAGFTVRVARLSAARRRRDRPPGAAPRCQSTRTRARAARPLRPVHVAAPGRPAAPRSPRQTPLRRSGSTRRPASPTTSGSAPTSRRDDRHARLPSLRAPASRSPPRATGSTSIDASCIELLRDRRYLTYPRCRTRPASRRAGQRAPGWPRTVRRAAGQNQRRRVGSVRRRRVRRPRRGVEVLARLDGADEQDRTDATGRLRAARRRRCARAGTRRGGRPRHQGASDLRGGVSEMTTTRSARAGVPCGQRGIVAADFRPRPLRVIEEIEVVDGDDLNGASRGHQQRMRRVGDVDRARRASRPAAIRDGARRS